MSVHPMIDVWLASPTSGSGPTPPIPPSPSSQPIGSIIYLPDGVAAPAGWLHANGLPVKKSDYPDLFTAIGTRFDNSRVPADHFNLPNVMENKSYGNGWILTGPETPGGLTLCFDPRNGDVYTGSERAGPIRVMRGGRGTWEATSSPSFVWAALAVNPVNGDVWAGARNGLIHVQRGGTGPWISTASGAALWIAFAIHNATGDVWAGAADASLHVCRAGGSSQWEPVAAGTSGSYVVVCDQNNGDIYVCSTNGNSVVLRGGVLPAEPTGLPSGVWRAGTWNPTTGAVYLCASTGAIYVKYAGVNTWERISHNGIWHGIACDPITGDLWASEYGASGTGLSARYECSLPAPQGTFKWFNTGMGASWWFTMGLHPITREPWVAHESSMPYRLPVYRCPAFIRAK